jgi:hypothetical protein
MTSVLRLEARRNVTPLLLPVLAVLLWFSPYGRSLGDLALWPRRSGTLQESLLSIGPFMAGVAAWMASRDGRRQTRDLLVTTARPGWLRMLSGWAATTLWGLLFYAVATGVLFTLTARTATWGGPIWWPVWVGAVGIVAFSAAGYALGTLLPGRFVAPLTAIGSFLLLAMGGVLKTSGNPYGLISPVGEITDPSRSVFFRAPSDPAVVQLTFLAGVTVLALGMLAVPSVAGGRWVRGAGVLLVTVGTASVATGFWVVGNARVDPHQRTFSIPRLSSATSQRPIAYTPVCDHSPIPVCLHPAYRRTIDDVGAALRPVTVQLAGLPGNPVRIDLRMSNGPVERDSSVLYLAAPLNSGGRIAGREARMLRADATLSMVIGRERPNPAQQAVALAVIADAGDPMELPGLFDDRGPDGTVTAAAHRFAALAPATRRNWLAAHIDALRTGKITVAELP